MVIQRNKIVTYIPAVKNFYNSSTFLVTILPKKKLVCTQKYSFKKHEI